MAELCTEGCCWASGVAAPDGAEQGTRELIPVLKIFSMGSLIKHILRLHVEQK